MRAALAERQAWGGVISVGFSFWWFKRGCYVRGWVFGVGVGVLGVSLCISLVCFVQPLDDIVRTTCVCFFLWLQRDIRFGRLISDANSTLYLTAKKMLRLRQPTVSTSPGAPPPPLS